MEDRVVNNMRRQTHILRRKKENSEVGSNHESGKLRSKTRTKCQEKHHTEKPEAGRYHL